MRILDQRDEILLHQLQRDARQSVSALARQVGLSRTAVQERINRLQRDGVIQGYTVKLNPAWLAGQLTAFISMVVDPKRNNRVIAALEKLPALQALWSVSGRNDLVALVRAPTTAEIDQLLDEVGTIDGVTRTESSIILSTKFDRG